MGYHVELIRSSAVIPKEVQDEVLQIWKDLNKPENDHQKNGGTYQGGKTISKHYSWMDPAYDQKVKSCQDVLDALGFDYEEDGYGNISITRYDKKMGQEELFFDAVSHLITGHMLWIGEDDDTFRWNFKEEYA